MHVALAGRVVRVDAGQLVDVRTVHVDIAVLVGGDPRHVDGADTLDLLSVKYGCERCGAAGSRIDHLYGVVLGSLSHEDATALGIDSYLVRSD